MSLKQAKAFLARIDEDETLRDEVRKSYIEELLRKARELGFEVTADDLTAAARELTDVGEELSLQQLEAIAGGRDTQPREPIRDALKRPEGFRRLDSLY